MLGSGKYALKLEGFVDTYQAPELAEMRKEDFYLRITSPAQKKNPIESFFAKVPASYADKTLEAVIAYVFPADQKARDERKDELETDVYAELPELYDSLTQLFDKHKAPASPLKYSINNGPRNVPMTATANEHMSLSFSEEDNTNYKILHFVLDE